MATLIPQLQQFLDLRDGRILCVSKVKLLTTSDTFTVPAPANTTASASCAGLRPAGSASVTVTQSTNTVTVAGTVGDTIYVATLHSLVNSGAEA